MNQALVHNNLFAHCVVFVTWLLYTENNLIKCALLNFCFLFYSKSYLTIQSIHQSLIIRKKVYLVFKPVFILMKLTKNKFSSAILANNK
jgi:hypothetical protein